MQCQEALHLWMVKINIASYLVSLCLKKSFSEEPQYAKFLEIETLKEINRGAQAAGQRI